MLCQYNKKKSQPHEVFMIITFNRTTHAKHMGKKTLTCSFLHATNNCFACDQVFNANFYELKQEM